MFGFEQVVLTLLYVNALWRSLPRRVASYRHPVLPGEGFDQLKNVGDSQQFI